MRSHSVASVERVRQKGPNSPMSSPSPMVIGSTARASDLLRLIRETLRNDANVFHQARSEWVQRTARNPPHTLVRRIPGGKRGLGVSAPSRYDPIWLSSQRAKKFDCPVLAVWIVPCHVPSPRMSIPPSRPSKSSRVTRCAVTVPG